MKHLFIIIFSVITCSAFAQQQTLPSADSLKLATVSFTPDSSLLSPSYYLQRAAKKQTQELLWFGGGALMTVLGAAQDSDGGGRPAFFIGATVCGVMAVIKHIGAVYNLKMAGKSLERVHIRQGGISIDL